MISALKADEPNMLARMNAEGASRCWIVTVAEILHTLHDNAVLAKLGLDRPVEECAEEAESYAVLFFELIVRSASQRSWTQCTMSELPPHCWCAVVSSDVEEANRALRQMRADYAIVSAARAALQQDAPAHPEHEAQIKFAGLLIALFAASLIEVFLGISLHLLGVRQSGLEGGHEELVVPHADYGGRSSDSLVMSLSQTFPTQPQ